MMAILLRLLHKPFWILLWLPSCVVVYLLLRCAERFLVFFVNFLDHLLIVFQIKRCRFRFIKNMRYWFLRGILSSRSKQGNRFTHELMSDILLEGKWEMSIRIEFILRYRYSLWNHFSLFLLGRIIVSTGTVPLRFLDGFFSSFDSNSTNLFILR